jgi:signal transduction histidine kinase
MDPSSLSRLLRGKQDLSISVCLKAIRKLSLAQPDREAFIASLAEERSAKTFAALAETVRAQGTSRTAPSARLKLAEPIEEACALLLSSLDPIDTSRNVARALAMAAGGGCVVHAVSGNGGGYQDPVAAHVDPAEEATLAELAKTLSPDEPRSDFGEGIPLRIQGKLLGVARLTSSPDERAPSIERTVKCAAAALENARIHSEARAGIRLRDELIAVVSHDLLNPLTCVLHNVELLTAAQPDARFSRHLGAIRLSARQMRHLAESLLSLKKLESGTAPHSPLPQPAGSILTDAIAVMRPIAAAKGIELSWDGHSRDCVVSCDRAQVFRVLSNLIGNAVKFSPEGSSVRIKVDRTEHELIFSVADSGPGIPAEHLSRIFERFWRVGNVASLGTGLGLSIAHEIVRAHGGKIWAESDLGKGSTFVFTLPLDQASAPPSIVSA